MRDLADPTPSPPSWAVEARGLGKTYGNITAVGGVDLYVAPGEFFGLLGPNGAGKTTTIHMLTTLLRPTQGSAAVAGMDVMRFPLGVRQRIGIVFQETTLDLELTAEENLRFVARLYGLNTRESAERVNELIFLFGLEARRHDRVRTFSGGMRRALDLARGLLHRPAVLFLDEPTLGLDPVQRRTIWKYLHALRERESTTLFVSTHYLEEADGCDRVAIIDRGRIVVAGAPEQLKRTYGEEILEIDADGVDGALIAEIEALTGRAPEVTPRGLRLSVDGVEKFFPVVVPLLGASLKSASVRRPTLEDVFVAVTSRATGERIGSDA